MGGVALKSRSSHSTLTCSRNWPAHSTCCSTSLSCFGWLKVFDKLIWEIRLHYFRGSDARCIDCDNIDQLCPSLPITETAVGARQRGLQIAEEKRRAVSMDIDLASGPRRPLSSVGKPADTLRCNTHLGRGHGEWGHSDWRKHSNTEATFELTRQDVVSIW